MFLKYLLFSILVLICLDTRAQFAKENYSASHVASKGLTDIRFVGTGDLQVALEEGDDLAASTGLGALFWRISPNEDYDGDEQNMSGTELQLELKINVASTAETIETDLGNGIS